MLIILRSEDEIIFCITEIKILNVNFFACVKNINFFCRSSNYVLINSEPNNQLRDYNLNVYNEINNISFNLIQKQNGASSLI